MNNLVYRVVQKLIDRGLKISSAESCTGGMFSKYITDVSGSSQILDEAYVTYSNEAKTKILGVKKETLAEHGAVSYETASEMASGLYRLTDADICVCFTGIAGPGGGSAEKPVGLVYLAIAFSGTVEVFKLNLSGNRDEVRKSACMTAFEIIDKKFN